MRQKAYALIVEEDKLLLVRYYYPRERAWYWNFPGGTREPGEELEETVRRELMEECCVEVEVGPMLLREALPGRDYIRNFYRCRISKGVPCVSDNPATNDSIGAIEWVPLDNPAYCGEWGRRNFPLVMRALSAEKGGSMNAGSRNAGSRSAGSRSAGSNHTGSKHTGSKNAGPNNAGSAESAR